MTFNDFLGLVAVDHRNHPHWRYGQAVFNTLENERPELANRIRGTEHDPFFTTTLFVINDCLDFIEKEWK